VELIPVKIDFMQVNTVKDKDERKWLVDTMTRLCRVFGSKVQEKEDCLEISTSL
jgi:predicted enzyme involved in methoxymalonyl-ACP biosynthesis